MANRKVKEFLAKSKVDQELHILSLMGRIEKVNDDFQDFQQGKYDRVDYEQMLRETLMAISQEPLIQCMIHMSEDEQMVFGSLMNKFCSREDWEPPFYQGPEIEFSPEFLEEIANQEDKNESKSALTTTLESIWQNFGETTSGSEQEY